MIITEIVPKGNHLCEIVTNGTVFYLDKTYLKQTGLKVGNELTSKEISFHLKESDYMRAKSKALWLLDRADRSEKVLAEKLVQSGIKKETAKTVIERLKELGLVDNRRYAENLARYYLENNRSKRQTFAKLYEKGLPSELIKEVLSGSETDEKEQIKAVIEKKYKAKLETKENRQKTVAALLRRGFNYGSIKSALAEYEIELESEEYC